MSNSMKAMRVVRGMTRFLCVALLLLAYSAISTQTVSGQNEAHRIRNIGASGRIATSVGAMRAGNGCLRPSFTASTSLSV
jgi:hypothetical protein